MEFSGRTISGTENLMIPGERHQLDVDAIIEISYTCTSILGCKCRCVVALDGNSKSGGGDYID